MTDCKRIFFDTTPLIYYLEKNDLYYRQVGAFLAEHHDADFCTSTISIMEFLVQPYKEQNDVIIGNFGLFLQRLDFKIEKISVSIAKKAASIRASYPTFKSMDALQLATACAQDCDFFLTNDKQLRQFSEIECLMVDDLLQP